MGWESIDVRRTSPAATGRLCPSSFAGGGERRLLVIRWRRREIGCPPEPPRRDDAGEIAFFTCREKFFCAPSTNC